MSEQYNQHNNIELSGILNDIPENNLDKVLIDICHDFCLEIEPKTLRVAVVYQSPGTVGLQ